eukprot:gene5832-8046_t
MLTLFILALLAQIVVGFSPIKAFAKTKAFPLDFTPTNLQRKAPFANPTPISETDNKFYASVGAAGVLSNVICAYSLYVLRTTSCGLPPGPFGILGAAEGISYLVVSGTFVWSIYTKIKTGSGLPAGPSGLLGASEGLSFLVVLAGLVIGVLNFTDYGFLPGFLPNDKCFGVNS